MTFAEISLKRPISTIMFFVSLMVIGAIAAVRLPLEFFPAVDAPFVFVNIPYPGSTPAEIERTITRPIEEALSTLPGIRQMNSSSRPDNAQIFMQFEWGDDVAIKASEVRSKIDAIRGDLPTDLQRYFVQKFSTGDAPILAIRLASGKWLNHSTCMTMRSPGLSTTYASTVPGQPVTHCGALPARWSVTISR
jgi:HAE1 family hydrophobic/amphiphilic exporter-1